jgi:hypothetical protein
MVIATDRETPAQYPRLAPPPPELPPPKLLEPPLLDDPLDEELVEIRGRTFVYCRWKVQNAHCSTTRALPLELVVAASMTVCLDDFVR